MANLTTLQDYKTAEGLQSAKEDLRIESLIPAVSQLVKTYCGNSLIDYYIENKTEFFNINWETNVVQLTESPVNTIVSVHERSGLDQAYVELTTGNYEYYLDEATDSLLRTSGGSSYRKWPQGPGAVKVVYTAGYSEVPSDLKLAVHDLITYYLKDEHKERQTLAGASQQNASTTSMKNSVAFPDHIKRVLDLYKNF